MKDGMGYGLFESLEDRDMLRHAWHNESMNPSDYRLTKDQRERRQAVL